MAGLYNKGPMFVIQHWANSMITSTSEPDDVWFVDSCASNHMTSHQEWFMNLREAKRPGMVGIDDDSTYTIEHIGDVAFYNHDNKGYIKDVLHVLAITRSWSRLARLSSKGESMIQPGMLLHRG